MKNNLPNFANASILVIGDIMLDRYWFGDAQRISPEAPVPIVKIRQHDERPGGAGNVALNLSTLGTNVTLLGIAGKDDTAQILKQQLNAANVAHDILSLDTPTITKLRVISRHQQLIRLDTEEKFPAYDSKLLIDLYKKHLAKADLVILSDYSKGTLNCAPELIALARAVNIPVLVDPKGTNFTIYRNATALTPNLKELEAIVGACENEQDIINKSRQLLTELNVAYLLLTRGEGGMTLIPQNGEEVHLPAHAREVYDVTGAGDTVIAVFGAAIAAGSEWPQAMFLANLAASLVVAKLGAASVSVPELDVALRGATTFSTGILNEDQLFSAMSEAKLRGKKIVFTNGCFDILHAGHVTYLQQAKQLGDYLIVAINDNASVSRLKGPGRPINSVEQRMAVLSGLGVVDWVTSFSDDTPTRLIKRLQPDILVKGGDYTVETVVGHEIVQAYGGEVRVLGVIKNLSTSHIINRVIKQQNEITSDS